MRNLRHDHRLPATDYPPPTTRHRPPTSDLQRAPRLPAIDLRPLTSDPQRVPRPEMRGCIPACRYAQIMANGSWTRTALVVEDHTLMRALVSDALRHVGFDVHDSPSAALALDGLDRIDPDVLVTDIDLGSRPNGVELASIVRRRSPQTAVVFLSNLPRSPALDHAHEVVERASFVNKSAIDSVDDIVIAIDAALADAPVNFDIPEDDPRAAFARLSSTQLDTVRRIASGWSNAEIARQRGVSVRAVEKSIGRAFMALGISSDEAVTPRVTAAARYITAFGLPVADQRANDNDSRSTDTNNTSASGNDTHDQDTHDQGTDLT